MAKRISLRERFEAKYEPVPWSGCWIWLANTVRHGSGEYGRIGAGGWHGRPLLAHRVSYELHKGEIPVGKMVLHHCDVGVCVNPAHLYLGTQQDNMRDRDARKRRIAPKGEKCGSSKLTWGVVRKIRADNRTLKEIAVVYGISTSQAWNIKRHKHWIEA